MLGQPGRDLLHIFNQHLNFRVMGKEMTVERKGKKWKEKRQKERERRRFTVGKGRNEIGERKGRERRRKGKGERKGETQKP